MTESSRTYSSVPTGLVTRPVADKRRREKPISGNPISVALKGWAGAHLKGYQVSFGLGGKRRGSFEDYFSTVAGVMEGDGIDFNAEATIIVSKAQLMEVVQVVVAGQVAPLTEAIQHLDNTIQQLGLPTAGTPAAAAVPGQTVGEGVTGDVETIARPKEATRMTREKIQEVCQLNDKQWTLLNVC